MLVSALALLALCLTSVSRAFQLPPLRSTSPDRRTRTTSPDRRTALASLGRCCATALFALSSAAPGTASVPEEGPIFEEDLEDGLPPAVMMLRIVEQTEFQEQMLRRSAALSNEDRFAQGVLIGPNQLKTSVDNLIRNTRLSELPACAPAVRSLCVIKSLAGRSSDKLSPRELLQAADQYAIARVQVSQAFDRLPEEEQRAGRALTLRLRASEDERARGDTAETARLVGSEEWQRALKEVVVDSEVRRRRLGQRTSTSELSPRDVERVLYGEQKWVLYGEQKSPFEQLLQQLSTRPR